jgi:N-acetylglucosamine transport system permease protein
MTQTSADLSASAAAATASRRAESIELRRPPRTAGDKVVGAVSHTVLTIWSLLVVVPLVWVVMSSFKTTSEIFASPFALPSSLNFTNYANAWTTAGIGSFFFNSVIVVLGALFVTMLFGSMSAYVLARFTFPGSRVLYYLMLAGLTFPVFLAIVPLFFVLRGIGLLNTLPGLILTYAAFAFPFTVFFLFAFFRSLSKSIAEAAAIDGAGEWRTFFQVMLPMAKPGLATVAILNFVGLWNQFLLPVALNTNRENYVLTQGMAAFASQAGYSVDFGALFAAVVITVIPVLIIYLIFQRQLQGSVSQGTNK